jgi:hypothetical protein
VKPAGISGIKDGDIWGGGRKKQLQTISEG